MSDYLDRAPAKLQPYVGIADVFGPEAMTVRLFGTQLVERARFEPTGQSLGVLYDPVIRARMFALVCSAVTQPAGYLCTRRVVAKSGIVAINPSIGLPIVVANRAYRSLITYSVFGPMIPELAPQDKFEVVITISLDAWIDLGAGRPDVALPD